MQLWDAARVNMHFPFGHDNFRTTTFDKHKNARGKHNKAFVIEDHHGFKVPAFGEKHVA